MKYVLLALALIAAFSSNAEARRHRSHAKAKKITCRQAGESSSYIAIFRGVGTTKNTVDLTVPAEGKNKAKTIHGTCDTQEGSIELNLACSLKKGEDTYDLSLFSTGGAQLSATVIHSNAGAKDEPLYLDCENK